MLPLLQSCADGAEHRTSSLADDLAERLGLSEEELTERLPNRQTKFRNRLAWAQVHLKKAGLLESPGRGLLRITPQGQRVLQLAPPKIDLEFLSRIPEYGNPSHDIPGEPTGGPREVEPVTPEEKLDAAYEEIRAGLRDELLALIKTCSPQFFEQLVVDLIVALGYGGSSKDAGQAIGRTGDGGIDGIIKEDRLGLDRIYLQAKRWANTVGRPEVQKFAGALEGRHARKGVLLTTSSFSSGSVEYVKSLQSRIVLVDGQQLVDLMIDCGLGINEERPYVIYSIDEDYFEER